MYEGKIVFAQLMEHLPLHTLRRCIERFGGDRSVKSFSCQDQFRCMAFAQLTYRESLRDIDACLNAQSAKLYHMGIRGRISLDTGGRQRDPRLAYLSGLRAGSDRARALYANEPLGVESTAPPMRSTPRSSICACRSSRGRHSHQGGVKLHTKLDLRGNIPVLCTSTTASPRRRHPR